VDIIADTEPVNQLTFVLSAYALNGTWLGYQEWLTELQLCGINADEGGLWR